MSRNKQKINTMIGFEIKKLRKRLGMTQKEFAGILGCSHQMLSKVERGDNQFSLVYLITVKKKFKINLDEWLVMEQGNNVG